MGEADRTALQKMAAAFVAHVREEAKGDWIGGDDEVMEFDGAIDVPAALRAALLAIREPTAQVLAAGARERERSPTNMNPWPVYTAMIDAIVNEKPGGER